MGSEMCIRDRFYTQRHTDDIAFLLFVAGSDYYYNIGSEILTFTPGGDPVQCVAISIIDDTAVEHSEVFSLSLIVLDDQNSQVVIDESASVTVLDNDQCKKTKHTWHLHVMSITHYHFVHHP